MDASNGFLACMPTMPEFPPDCPVWTQLEAGEIEENQWTRAALQLKPVKQADADADAIAVSDALAVFK